MFRWPSIYTHSLHFSTSAGDIFCITEGNIEQMAQGDGIELSKMSVR